MAHYEIHPSIGIARVGNSPDSFYLPPDAVGGLPIECDSRGNPKTLRGQPVRVSAFKDPQGRVRRQAALFQVLAHDDGAAESRVLTLDSPEVERIEWTVHLANKKGAWYVNQEFDGDLMLGPNNSYAKRKVPLRNATVAGDDARRKLIIDPGPRTVSEPGKPQHFAKRGKTAGYRFTSFPSGGLDPFDIDTLGQVLMNDAGALAVLGGHGLAGGAQIIATYTGADSWYDDTSDGPVTCRLTLKGQKTPIVLRAWVMVTPPKFAPELRNITTLDDVAIDVAVRFQQLEPSLYDLSKKRWLDGWNPNYTASFERDIKPILERIGDYQWVANVPTMTAFARPRFDPRDSSAAMRPAREAFFRYFRRPAPRETHGQHGVLNSPSGLPLMPLNAGSNPITNDEMDKYMTLTLTQYALLRQWATGKFTAGTPAAWPRVHALDHASLGNCVGHPMSPGVETSWNTRNPSIYDRPYRIRHRADESYYARHGLSPSRDECRGGGCEPGDLTKRMSPPWQSDLYQCSVEWISFAKPSSNYVNPSGMPEPPNFYAYWWPPQAPMYVMVGDVTAPEQDASGVVAGQQVPYMRGLDNISRVVLGWSYLGFVLNANTAADRAEYPSFVERERRHDRFVATSVAVGHPVNQTAAAGMFIPDDNYFQPMWFLKNDSKEDPLGVKAYHARAGSRRRHRGR